jgi:Clp amino terminal domain, pathogenicity island component
MFERYTERARRVIFFGRYEASRFGSHTIETEHLLLGLLREDRSLFDRLLPNTREDLQRKIEEQLPSRPKISTSVDLPLSNECRRILAYANEESDKLNHRFIGTEHLLLGILRESGCMAARVLGEAGYQFDRIRETVAKSEPENASAAPDPPLIDRSALHALVDKISHDRLRWAGIALNTMLHIPLDIPQPAEIGFDLSRIVQNVQEGRVSANYRSEDGELVVASQQFLGGNKIIVEERFRLSQDGKKLLYSHEVTGPKPEQRHKHSFEFDITA